MLDLGASIPTYDYKLRSWAMVHTALWLLHVGRILLIVAGLLSLFRLSTVIRGIAKERLRVTGNYLLAAMVVGLMTAVPLPSVFVETVQLLVMLVLVTVLAQFSAHASASSALDSKFTSLASKYTQAGNVILNSDNVIVYAEGSFFPRHGFDTRKMLGKRIHRYVSVPEILEQYISRGEDSPTFFIHPGEACSEYSSRRYCVSVVDFDSEGIPYRLLTISETQDFASLDDELKQTITELRSVGVERRKGEADGRHREASARDRQAS